MILGVTGDRLNGRLHAHHHDTTSPAFQESEVSVQRLIYTILKLPKLKRGLRRNTLKMVKVAATNEI
jgi:hypothetical protein